MTMELMAILVAIFFTVLMSSVLILARLRKINHSLRNIEHYAKRIAHASQQGEEEKELEETAIHRS